MSEALQTTSTPPEQPVRRSPLRRAGCLIGLVLWFLLLLAPCGLFYLATQGEIALTLNESPPQILRVWLVMEAQQRGVGISRPTVFADPVNQTVCIQTDVSFLLWQGQGDNLASTYCDCYAQNDDWALVNTSEGDCRP